MADTALLFFVGLASVVALSRFVALLYQPQNVWAIPAGIKLVLVLAISLVALAAVFAFPTLCFWPWPSYSGFWEWPFYGWVLLRTIALGCWIAFLAGCVAGFVIAAALNAIPNWASFDSKTDVILLAAGPAITVIVLYLLATPGFMQKLGLTSIKAGEFEISLTPPAAPSIGNNVPSLVPQQTVGTLPGEYTPWFSNVWPMFKELDDPSGKQFMDMEYFQREAAYIAYAPATSPTLDEAKRLKIPLTLAEAKQYPPAYIPKTIWQQEEFLRSLRPMVGCAGFYHLKFPDVPSMRPMLTPTLETLVGIETELEAIAKLPPNSVDRTSGRSPQKWVNGRLDKLKQQVAKFIWDARDKIPPAAQSSERPKDDSPSWNDCVPLELPIRDVSFEDYPFRLNVKSPAPDGLDLELQPPYLAMAIANVYAALGDKGAGLKVLNTWIKSYPKFHGASEYTT